MFFPPDTPACLHCSLGFGLGWLQADCSLPSKGVPSICWRALLTPVICPTLWGSLLLCGWDMLTVLVQSAVMVWPQGMKPCWSVQQPKENSSREGHPQTNTSSTETYGFGSHSTPEQYDLQPDLLSYLMLIMQTNPNGTRILVKAQKIIVCILTIFLKQHFSQVRTARLTLIA